MESNTSATQADWIADAERRRDRGIAGALTHAEAAHLGWRLRADELLDRYLEVANGKPFLTEQFVEFTVGYIKAPPDPRAWGGVIRRAAQLGKIVGVGYARAASSNMSPKCLWQGRAR